MSRTSPVVLGFVLVVSITLSGAPISAQLAPYRVGGPIRPPAKIKNVAPVYPEPARNARVQGVVILEALVDRQGRVESVRVLRSIPLLDNAAIAAVRQWRYSPLMLNGQPERFVLTVTLSFGLST